jgi:cytochrome c2
MKIKTDKYTIFYKSNNKWKTYSDPAIYTLKEIHWDYDTIEDFLKACRRQVRKPIKLMRLVWED